MDAFREALDQARDADLVDHFGQLARAGRPEQLAHAGIGRDHRLGAGIGFGAAAAHHGQHAVFRTGLAAGHRGVDELETGLGGGGIEFAGDLGGGGGVVDEGGALLHAGESAVRAEGDRAQVIVVADAAHHEILAFRGGFGGGCGLAAELLRPGLGFGRSPVENRDLVTTFFHQMACHGKTHHAETEKSDFSHVCNPGVLPALDWPDRVLERGGGPVRCARPVPLRMWNGHHKPWPAKGNGCVWRAGGVLC